MADFRVKVIVEDEGLKKLKEDLLALQSYVANNPIKIKIELADSASTEIISKLKSIDAKPVGEKIGSDIAETMQKAIKDKGVQIRDIQVFDPSGAMTAQQEVFRSSLGAIRTEYSKINKETGQLDVVQTKINVNVEKQEDLIRKAANAETARMNSATARMNAETRASAAKATSDAAEIRNAAKLESADAAKIRSETQLAQARRLSAAETERETAAANKRQEAEAKVAAELKKQQDIKVFGGERLDIAGIQSWQDKINTAMARLQAFGTEGQKVTAITNALNQSLDAVKGAENFDQQSVAVEKLRISLASIGKEVPASQTVIDNLRTKIEAWLTNNTAAAKEFGGTMQNVIDQLQVKGVSVGQVEQLGKEFNIYKQQADAAGLTTDNFTTRIGKMFTKFTEWYSVSRIMMEVVQTFKQMIGIVIETDRVMTNLRMVTGVSAEEAQSMMKTYQGLASELSSTTTEVAKSAEIWLNFRSIVWKHINNISLTDGKFLRASYTKML